MIIGMDTDTSIYNLMEDWSCWKTRIIAYSKLEKAHRPKLRTLLSSLESSSENEGKTLISVRKVITKYFIL